ncbi:hypothetical protein CALVIDRAFT_602896 [Calocera viscosa TUFC12733]|uniref:Uncharacterized protein n=1 Tax=Calocera viscosa (strain TUFC12733) TaxID=1330018 RepID=A0A167GFC3_CALVF|nr:hypothetical protein CALVIDRAFT_602896 [Calocera viscosa TUFC12733]
MAHLSDQERTHHFTAMKTGSVESTLDITPWQSGYSPRTTYDEHGSINRLAEQLDLVLHRMQELGRDHRSSPTSQACSKPLADLRAVDTLSAQIDGIHRCYHAALHKLRCQAFLTAAPSAPITRLPDDILALIFELLGDTLRHYSSSMEKIIGGSYFLHKARPAQVVLASVCSRWRTAAHSAKALWTNVVWDESLPIAALEEWLSRGGNAPLDLTVVVTQCSSQSFATRLEVIRRVSPRLQALTLVGHTKFLHDIAQHWIDPAPLLNELSVQRLIGHCRIKPAVRCTTVRALHTVPSLRSLTVTGLRPPLEFHPASECHTTNALRQLTLEFNNRTTHLETILSLLRSSPLLQVLELRKVCFCTETHAQCFPDGFSGELVVLPDLEELEVKQPRRACFRWLQVLEVPNLYWVDMWPNKGWQEWLDWDGPEEPVHPLSVMGFVKS